MVKITIRKGRMAKGKIWLIVSAVLAGALVLGTLVFLLVRNVQMRRFIEGSVQVEDDIDHDNTIERVNVHGTISYTALTPDEAEMGEVHIFQRTHGSGNFTDTGIRVATIDGAQWDWPNALSGQNYDMMATLYIGGEAIISSKIVTVTAPAADTPLELAIYWEDLPSEVVKEHELTVSGKIAINGYIPEGAKLNIYETSPDQTRNLIQTITAVTNANVWTWNGALPGQNYIVDATLVDARNNQIGMAEQSLIARRGDAKLNLMINSQAVPTPTATPTPIPVANPNPPADTPTPVPTPIPTPRGKISGYVTLNGPLNANSSLLILWRYPGQGDYQPAVRINNPTNINQYWEWDGAEVGKSYEMLVALQVNEQNTSTPPQSLIVTAPAENVNFTLNTNFVVPGPPRWPYLDGCSNRSGDTWNANLVFPMEARAGNYWIQVGNNDVNNPNNVFNRIVRVAGMHEDYRMAVQVHTDWYYWVRFSQSYCANCSNPNNFSAWSPSIKFTCFN